MRITNDLFPSEIYITEDEKGPVYNQPREHLDEKAMMSVPVKSQREIEQMIDEANKMSKISEDYRFCIKNVINTTLFKEDFYNLDSGNIVQVSKKYCQNVPAFLKCNDIYRYQIDKYANGDNRADPSIIKLIFEETFITFICSLDSQSLTEFYVVGGLQCLYVLSKPLNQCVNLSFSKYKQTHLSDSDTGREFENQCKYVLKYSTYTTSYYATI
ncbi:Protein of unknown function DUF1397 [Cinara cedri]|uniref:Uncharacterized protein n=1 Tax=Cinara cedri TaxID=506608 RepID=A0A5E4MR12_9HEMI|nr:Protein of unknown function DUF1397 [Cinara cedri]